MVDFRDFAPGFWAQMGQDVLADYEPAQYYSAPAGLQFGARSPRRRRYFQDAYQNILKDFYQQEGTALREGRAPMGFMDYLETDPWTRRYAQLPQTVRGTTGMATSPRTRFLFNY